MDELGDIVQEFLVESHENLDQLDRDLVALEQQPGSRELLSSIFRTIHTIKGTSGFLAFNRLERVTHAGENLLARLRDGTQVMTPETTDALLRMVDVVRTLLTAIEESGAEGDVDVDGVIEAVTQCIDGGTSAKPPADPTAPVPSASAPTASVPSASAPPVAEAAGDDEPNGADAGAGQARRSIADGSIRVDVDVLDTLMRLVGELVLTRNQMLRAVTASADPALVRTGQRLNLITSELQESVMKTRMQAIDHLWSKLPRVVRDLSSSVGKQIRLAMVGRETELDRSLLEAVKDPLTHLVRNAVDHGIEGPAARKAAGKPVEGVLTLRAYHEGGHVIVEVADDGKGMDPDRIAEVAVQRGVITRDQAAHMDRREILNLVFRPGFSTAEKVTNVSGRGVGMDVVKTNIERIGGAVDVDSTLGVGTTWRLRIPLTLAIIQALTVECGTERYAIPQVAVHELVYLDGQNGRVIEHAMGAQVYRLDTLLAPAGPADGERVNRDLVSEMLKVARRVFDYVIIDTPPVFSDQVLAALDVSDFYLLLATPDIPSLKNLRLTLDMFDLLEYGRDQRIVVLNRADSRVGLTLGDIERVVRSPIVGHVPSTRDVPVSINQGTPLMVGNPTHPVSRAIRDLAEAHLSTPVPVSHAAAVPEARQSRKKPFSLRRGR